MIEAATDPNDFNEDGFTPAQREILITEYKFFLSLEADWRICLKFATGLGLTKMLDNDRLLQSYWEDVLTDEARSVWNKWTSGGTATAEEWTLINEHWDI